MSRPLIRRFCLLRRRSCNDEDIPWHLKLIDRRDGGGVCPRLEEILLMPAGKDMGDRNRMALENKG
jgi:hypothetical protein